jgi:hypothetical protein
MSDICTIENRNSTVKVEENASKALFTNVANETFLITRIDGCLVKNGVRADYLVRKTNVASVIVELKGSNVSHACDQIFASMCNNDVKQRLEKQIGFLIVCTRIPKFDTSIAKAKQLAARKYKCGLHVLTYAKPIDILEVCKIDGQP